MGTELEIALVLSTAFLWVTGTFAILSAIDRSERKARRRERRASRAGKRRVLYGPAVKGSRLAEGTTPPRPLHPQ
ncbi:hypothetical protein [Pseudarthrobacter oxydans]|uniref:hypothetical protein n=1 Tax=Pseudarthrobacter oxydans TaxID=1671 RepID=UPI00344DE619